MKKGLARHKNHLSAKKKDLLSRQLQPPEDLSLFLQSDETFEEILKIAHVDEKDITVRRYEATCARLLQPVSIV